MLSEFVLVLAAVLLAAPMAAQDAAAFRQEYLGEFNSTLKHVSALAEAMPAEKYGWRPADGVRSVSEAFVHLAAGNFLLLGIAGQDMPAEWYPKAEGAEKPAVMALIKRNAELEKTVTGKAQVVKMVQQSAEAVRAAFDRASAADLEKKVNFFGRPTTVRAVYLRILAHVNEHMGQLVAYARMNGVVPPWSQPAPK